MLSAPLIDERDGAIHVAVLAPARVETGRLVRDADVVDERRDRGLGPHVLGGGDEAVDVEPGHITLPRLAHGRRAYRKPRRATVAAICYPTRRIRQRCRPKTNDRP